MNSPTLKGSGSFDAWRKHLKRYPLPPAYSPVPSRELPTRVAKARAEAIHKANLRRAEREPFEIHIKPKPKPRSLLDRLNDDLKRMKRNYN